MIEAKAKLINCEGKERIKVQAEVDVDGSNPAVACELATICAEVMCCLELNDGVTVEELIKDFSEVVLDLVKERKERGGKIEQGSE